MRNWISKIRSSLPGCAACQALVGRPAPFEEGREQMRVLAGLEVTTKAVERVAESMGEDIAGVSNAKSTKPCC